MNNNFDPHRNNPNNPNGIDMGRLVMAIAISLLVLIVYNYFIEQPRAEKAKAAQEAINKTIAVEDNIAAVDVKLEDKIVEEVAIVLAKAERFKVTTPKLSGSISLVGSKIDDVVLTNYYESIETKKADGERIHLLTPAGTEKPYYAEFGWVSADATINTPKKDSIWSFSEGSSKNLTPETPVSVEWDNNAGLLFKTVYSVDEDYMFTVDREIVNNTANQIKLKDYSLISRQGLPNDLQDFFILHEGPIGFVNKELFEIDYDDLADEAKGIAYDTVGSWYGFTDRYWLTALIPNQTENNKLRIMHVGESWDKGLYQADFLGDTKIVEPQGKISTSTKFYAGAKEIDVLQRYDNEKIVEQLELGLDFGMWFFITKPMLKLINFLSEFFGNFAIAIISLTVIMKIMVFPLTSRAYRSMAGMRKLAPKMKEIKALYGDDKQKLQKKIIELYNEEDVNPFSGCWPMLLQIPIFFALYKVLLLAVGMRHAPFWGWIDDMSVLDPTNVFELFGLFEWGAPSFMHVGIWPIIMGITMFWQKGFNPPPADPLHEKMMNYFPYFMTFIFAKFAAGLIVYWAWNNILTILQQFYIMRKLDPNITIFGMDKEKHKLEAKEADAAVDARIAEAQNLEEIVKKPKLKKKKSEPKTVTSAASKKKSKASSKKKATPKKPVTKKVKEETVKVDAAPKPKKPASKTKPKAIVKPKTKPKAKATKPKSKDD